MSSPARIGIIGAGPKGLYCLERLTAELHRTADRARIEVHVFEPHPHPGAGPVYDPDQPDYLRMNFANGKIDMWPRTDGPGGPGLSGPTFVEYLQKSGLATSAADYAPRRLVGRYLHEGFTRVIASLRGMASVTIHAETVTSIGKRNGRFDVSTRVGSLPCDEVLLATGHRSRSSPTAAGIAPYPVNRPGGVCDIAPGSTVAVRGIGLTAIDVALALTEGRGGRFIPTGTPGRLTYDPSGVEPRAVLPLSRTGRPMVPKPHPVLMSETEGIVAACHYGCRLLDALEVGGAGIHGQVVAALIETGVSVLRCATRDDGHEQIIRDHLAGLLSRAPIGPGRSMSAMEAAVATAFGRGSPGPDWALGTAWRGLYPALVRLVATRSLDTSWPQFSALATEMERVAFGPPAENAARFLALVDAGFVDMSFAAAPTLLDTEGGLLLRTGTSVRQADVLVDAVLDPPGAAPHPSPLVASLLRTGLARTTAHSPGLDVSADGTCTGAWGEATEGLAAVGRPTEGSVLGNDTLSRTLHDTPSRWARAALRRLAAPAATSAA